MFFQGILIPTKYNYLTILNLLFRQFHLEIPLKVEILILFIFTHIFFVIKQLLLNSHGLKSSEGSPVWFELNKLLFCA
jgi:hypothetical protein